MCPRRQQPLDTAVGEHSCRDLPYVGEVGFISGLEAMSQTQKVMPRVFSGSFKACAPVPQYF